MNEKEQLFADLFNNAYHVCKDGDIKNLDKMIQFKKEQVFRLKAELQGMQQARRELAGK